jgi:hypothetical protein
VCAAVLARADVSPSDPQDTVLHRIVRGHVATFLAAREEAGAPMPGFVVRELRRYLRCGVLAHGAACFRCEHCGRGRMVALSCGGRGFCPRCLGRHMTELAHEWVRWVLPHVRIRQWVFSLPPALRVALAFHHDLALAVHAVAMRAIEGWYRDKARALGIADGKTGSITAIQRFGSDLALNPHFHALVLDGVYDAGGEFTAITAPTLAEMETLVTTIARRIARMCERRAMDHDDLDPGELTAITAPTLAEMETLVTTIARRIARMCERRAMDHDDLDPGELTLLRAFARSASRAGASKHAPDGMDLEHDAPDWGGKIKARVDGYDLECTTVVRAEDRERLEHLCKYILRPPLADRRLRLLETGEVALELKTPWRDGTKWLTFEPDTFLERLCSLVPKKREHTVLYRGVLAGRSKLRAKVVPREEGIPRPKNATWCTLMKHGLDIDVLACPCGQRMKLVAVIFDKKSLARMLAAHGLRARVMPTLPARAPPQAELDFGA